jgi:hypothetical protein
LKSRFSKWVGGVILATLLLSGIVVFSPSTAEAQTRRRVVVVRPIPYRIYRPFGYRSWWGSPWGYDPWGYDSYRFRYGQYVFDNHDEAVSAGYKQGFKTGKDDGKKAKSFSFQRSHYYKEAGFGNFGEVYRSGFARGYQEGYRVGSNGRNAG